MAADIRIYHNPRCSKSRQTLERIEAAGYEPEVIRYLETPPDAAELDRVLDLLGVEPEAIVRTGEADYKEHVKGREVAMDRGQWIQAIVDHPKLLQRPIVVRGDRAVIGRPPENVDDLL